MDRAEELYREALAAQPGHVTLLGNLAGLLAERGELGRAEVLRCPTLLRRLVGRQAGRAVRGLRVA